MTKEELDELERLSTSDGEVTAYLDKLEACVPALLSAARENLELRGRVDTLMGRAAVLERHLQAAQDARENALDDNSALRELLVKSTLETVTANLERNNARKEGSELRELLGEARSELANYVTGSTGLHQIAIHDVLDRIEAALGKAGS